MLNCLGDTLPCIASHDPAHSLVRTELLLPISLLGRLSVERLSALVHSEQMERELKSPDSRICVLSTHQHGLDWFCSLSYPFN